MEVEGWRCKIAAHGNGMVIACLLACWWRAKVNAVLEPLLGGWLACRAPELCGDTLAHQTSAQPVRDPLDCTGLHNLSYVQFGRPEMAGRSCCQEEMHCSGSLRLFHCLKGASRFKLLSRNLTVKDFHHTGRSATYSSGCVLHYELNFKEGHY